MSVDTSSSDFCKLKFYNKRHRRAPLIVADFTSGAIRSGSHDKLKFECFKSNSDESISSKATRNLHSQGRLNYTGASSTTSPFNYFVAVRNKTTGIMKLYDATLFRLKPIIQPLQDSETQTATASKDYWDQVNDLTENFGSKLKKRALNARKNLTSEVTIKEVPDTPTPDAPTPAAKGLSYLPTVNRDATAITGVYNIYEIIPPEVDATLEKDACSLQDGSNENIKKLKFFGRFAHSQVKEEDLAKTKYLIYFSYLILFQHLDYKERQKKILPLDIHPSFKDNMLNTFFISLKSERGGVKRLMPQEMKDKLIAHIIILALYICDFKVNPDEIIGELKGIKLPKVIDIAHAIGCHTNSQKQGNQTKKIIQLKLPLFVTAPKFSRKAFR